MGAAIGPDALGNPHADYLRFVRQWSCYGCAFFVVQPIRLRAFQTKSSSAFALGASVSSRSAKRSS